LPDHRQSKIIELLTKPIQLFAWLYEFIESDYRRISNNFYNNPPARKKIEDLSRQFFESFKKVYSGSFTKNEQALDGLAFQIRCYSSNDGNYHILCLSLLKALGEYLASYGRSPLHSLTPLKINNLIITGKPPNPIYEKVKYPVKKEPCSNIQNISDVFERFSFIREEAIRPFRVEFLKNPSFGKTNSFLSQRVISDQLKIAVTPFMKNMKFGISSLKDQWPEGEPTPFWFTGINNKEKAKSSLDELLSLCLNEKVTILILPELMIDQELMSYLQMRLKADNKDKSLLMIVAGSFHCFEGKANDNDKDQDKLYNVSTILNHKGEILWTHKKMQRYSFIKEDFVKEDIENQPELKTLLELTGDAGGHERISLANTLCCVDTPIGRIMVCICIDYFDFECMSAFRQAGINLFFVPAMSHQNNQFQDTARKLGSTNQASTFMANSGCFCKKNGEAIDKKGASFYYLPDKRCPHTYAVGEHEKLLIFDLAKLTTS
jgi:predicted amidohydrolase